jgi:hypothetical protein
VPTASLGAQKAKVRIDAPALVSIPPPDQKALGARPDRCWPRRRDSTSLGVAVMVLET